MLAFLAIAYQIVGAPVVDAWNFADLARYFAKTIEYGFSRFGAVFKQSIPESGQRKRVYSVKANLV